MPAVPHREPVLSLERWSTDDLPVLVHSNTRRMTQYLGGPESHATLLKRHARYLRSWETGDARMFRIEVEGVPDPVGSVGYWEDEWHGRPVFESGWSVHTPYQDRGYATRAMRLLVADAAAHRTPERALLVAFPMVENLPSNALCSRLGFRDEGEQEYPGRRGGTVRVRAWSVDLRDVPAQAVDV